MALANDIQRALMNYVKGSYDVVLPNFFYGWNECDLFRINQSDFVFEYEIKVSRSDFFVDFKKDCPDGKKHNVLKTGTGQYCPNRFFYVTPKNLVTVEEVPAYAGLIYFKGRKNFEIQKAAPLIHKNKVGFEVYRDVCRTLSSRDEMHREKIRQIRKLDVEKEMSRMQKQLEKERQEKRKLGSELKTLRNRVGKVRW